jgi:glucokinase-like ROK family protein
LGRRYRIGGQYMVRELNLSTMMRCLREGAPLSRARLADLTGLNKTTVSSLVEELLDRGLIEEVGQATSGGGRPATMLELAPQAGCIIGVQFGVDFVAVVLTDFVGRILWRRSREADSSQGQDVVIAQAINLIDEARATDVTCGARVLGLGVASPGTVRVEEGLLVFSPNLQWRNVHFRDLFQQQTGLPVFVDNDANAAALAEHLFGVARQAQDFVFVFGGVGVGGGLFLNGELYRGTSGFAGEIGHTNFMWEGYRTPCRCGNRGCWETCTSQYSVVERVRARLAIRRNSLLPQLMAEQNSPLTFPLIVQAADAGDGEALESLAETGSAMGLGVANLISIFNPELVVIGGPLSTAGKYLLPAIRTVVEKTVLHEVQEQAEIVISAFGPDASLVGAAALVVEAILSSPSSVQRLWEQSQR